jgi:hypothetical protein
VCWLCVPEARPQAHRVVAGVSYPTHARAGGACSEVLVTWRGMSAGTATRMPEHEANKLVAAEARARAARARARAPGNRGHAAARRTAAKVARGGAHIPPPPRLLRRCVVYPAAASAPAPDAAAAAAARAAEACARIAQVTRHAARGAIGLGAVPDPARPVGDALHLLLDCPHLADNRARVWGGVRAALVEKGGEHCPAVAALEEEGSAGERLRLLLGFVPVDPEVDPGAAPGEPAPPAAWPAWAAAAAAAPAAWGVLDLWERRKELLYGEGAKDAPPVGVPFAPARPRARPRIDPRARALPALNPRARAFSVLDPRAPAFLP